jgi:hypothetical protein
MSDDTTGQRHTPSPHDRVLTRDAHATVIPAGEPAVLPAGTKVTITHRLGGNFSSSLVHAGGMLWIVSELGVCTAFAADPTEYRELGSGDMGEQVLASLAPAEGAFFLRTEGHLYRIE